MNKQNWNYNYFTIWTGQAVSLITSAVLQMAIIWNLTTKTGSALVLSLAAIAGFLPQAILGTMIGVLVDRWNRKVIMIAADMIIAASGLSFALLTLVIEPPIWVIFLVLFIRSVGTAFHSPAINAVTPLLVPEEQLTKCAGFSQSIQSVSYILSPSMAAFLYARWGLMAAVWLDVLGAIAACVTVAIISIPKQTAPTERQGNHFRKEIKEGYCAVKEHKTLFALLWIGVLYTFIYMPINSLIPLMSMNYFGGTTVHASVIETVFAAGMLAGGVLLSMWGGFKNHGVTIISSIGLMGIALICSGLLPESAFALFIPCSALMGFSVPFYNGIQMALFQEKIQPELLGRVFGLLGSVMSFAMPLGLIISGIYADKIGINRWFALSGICVLGIAVAGGALPSIRRQGKS